MSVVFDISRQVCGIFTLRGLCGQCELGNGDIHETTLPCGLSLPSRITTSPSTVANASTTTLDSNITTTVSTGTPSTVPPIGSSSTVPPSGSSTTAPPIISRMTVPPSGEGEGVIKIDPSDSQHDIDLKVKAAEKDGGDVIIEQNNRTTFAVGHMMCFEDSSLLAKRLPVFVDHFTTLEFLVKTCDEKDCRGVLFSYTETKTLFLHTLNGSVSVSYDNEIFDTGAHLETDEWNQITTVIDRKARHLYVYIVNSQGKLITGQRFDYQGNQIQPFGDLGLGRWQPAQRGSEQIPVRGFKGCIDDVRIWNK